MRIAILHQHVPDDALPDERDVLDEAAAVRDALLRLGHEVEIWPCTTDLSALERRLPSIELAFNIVETLGGSGRLGHLVPAVLEARGARFTGNSSAALMLSSDKPLAKRLLAAAGVPVPPSHREARGRCIVKPIWEDASLGIDDDAVVASPELAEARLSARGPGYFAEAYVPGREINLSILDAEVLPVAEIVFDGDWAAKPRIIGYDAKWTPSSFEYRHTRRVFPPDEPVFARVRDLARRAWEVLELSGYARVDLRIDEAGEPFVLEVNANPCISPDAGFAGTLEAARIAYDEAIRRIVAAARG